MNKLPWQWVCSIYQAKAAAVVHKLAVARMWIDIGVLGIRIFWKITLSQIMCTLMLIFEGDVDEIARMGKSTTLESLVRFCDAIETLYTRDYLRKPTPRDLQRFLQKAEARGFPSIIGSIDSMHWQWKNCPTAGQGDYRNRKGQKSQSPIFNDVLRGEVRISHEINSITTSTRGGPHLSNQFRIPDPRRKNYFLPIKRVIGKMLKGVLISSKLDERLLGVLRDKYDYDALDVFESDPMNTILTRIYENPMCSNGQPLEYELLVRDGHFMNPMID
ncbi:unnamed protein product [Prunus armeniaca]